MRLSMALDDPEKEDLSAVEKVVLVSELLADLLRFSPRVTRDDPVYEAVAEIAGGIEPCDESFLELPFLCILLDDPLEVVAVLVYQLARDDDDALVSAAVEMLVSSVQEYPYLPLYQYHI